MYIALHDEVARLPVPDGLTDDVQTFMIRC